MAFPNEKQWLEYLLAEYADRPASSGLAEQMFHAINTRLNHMKASGRTDDKDFLDELQMEIKRVRAMCGASYEITKRLENICVAIQRRLEDKPRNPIPYSSGGTITFGSHHGNGRTLRTVSNPEAMIMDYAIEDLDKYFSSPKSKPAMADTKQTNTSAPMSKADKRARIKALEQQKDELSKLKTLVENVKGRQHNGGLYVKDWNGYPQPLISPEFMSHDTYLKLYLNEIEESFARINAELDSLTA